MKNTKKIVLVVASLFIFGVCDISHADVTVIQKEMAASLVSNVLSNQNLQSLNTADLQNGLTPEQIFDKIKPSTVRIGVLYTGTLTLPTPKYDEKTNTYIPTSDVTQRDMNAYFLGSGFVINKDGYIVTSAHVVDSSVPTADEGLWEQYQNNLYSVVSDNLSAESSDTINAVYNMLVDYAQKNMTFDNETYQIVVFNPSDANKTFEEQFSSGYKADVRKMGNPYPQMGKDLAIIKIEKSDMVPIVIGDSDTVKNGDSVYVIGYPGIADLSDKTFGIPSFTSGIVSAIKPSDLGDYNVIQIDASIKGGNSGGPVVNKNGEVIGVATFGATDSDSYNWILPINLAKDYIHELNIQTLSPAVPDKNPFGPYIIPGIIILAVIIIAIVILFIIRFRKKKKGNPVQQTSVPPVIPNTPPPPVQQIQPTAPPAPATLTGIDLEEDNEDEEQSQTADLI